MAVIGDAAVKRRISSWSFAATTCANVVLILAKTAHWVSWLDNPVFLILPCVCSLGIQTAVVYWERPRSPWAIDSVYYLGFLTTLGVLGASAWSLSTGPGGSNSITNAGTQFALGLLATGLGLLLRLMLQSQAAASDNPSVELSRYVETIGQLSWRMEEAARNFERLTAETLQSASDTSKKATTSALASVTEGLEPAIKELRATVTGINKSLKRLDAGQMSSLSQAIADLEKSVTGVTTALADAQQPIQGYRAELGRTADSSAKVNESLAAMANSLGSVRDRLPPLDAALAKYESDLARTSAAQSGYAQSSEELLDSLRSTAGAVMGLGERLGNAASQLTLGFELTDLKSLNTVLTDTVQGLSSLGREVSQLMAALSSVQPISPKLSEATANLERQVGSMTQATADVGAAMVRLSIVLRQGVEEVVG